MNVLYLDCCYGMNVTLLAGEKVFSARTDKREHTDSLLLEVDKLIEQAGLDISQIDTFGVCLGPGSFTGIRVAVATVKGLASNDSKIFAFSAFDVLSYNNSGRAYFLLEGFSDNLFYRYHDGFAYVDRCESYADFIARVKETSEAVPIYVDSEKLQNLLKMNEILYQNAQNHLKELILSKINSNDFVGKEALVPIYLRLSQAELERKKSRLKRVMEGARLGECEPHNLDSLLALEKKLFLNEDRARAEAAAQGGALHKFFVMEYGGRVIAYLECQLLAPEAEIFELAVDPDFQGIGLSKQILDFAKKSLKALGCNTIFLEVNKINRRAINLYLSSGFCSYSERKNYYGDSDAILMKADI